MKFLFLLFVILISEASSGQNEILIPFKEGGGKFGYINIEGDVVIPAKYQQAHNFSNSGYAFVLEEQGAERPGPPRPGAPSVESVWKIIDTRGNEIKHPCEEFRPITKSKEYSNSRGFVDGKAIVDDGNGLVVLTVNMQVLFKEGYDKIYPFKDGFALAYKNGVWYVLKDDGTVNRFEDDMLIPKSKEFSYGLVKVIQANKGRSFFGFVNTDGKVAIQPEFEDVGEFTGCGYTWARSATDKDSIGIIDRSGEWIVNPILAMVMDFDKDAKATIATIGDAPYMHKLYRNNYNFNLKGQYAVIKASGESIPAPDSIKRLFKFSNGLAMFRLDRKHKNLGYLDSNCRIVVAPIYDEGKDFEGGIGIVGLDGKWGIIDHTGEELLPCEYDEIHSFHNGFVILEKKKLFGFYNTETRKVIEPKFSEVRHFKDGYAAALDPKTKRWGMIDTSGEWKIKPQYEMLYYATSIDRK